MKNIGSENIIQEILKISGFNALNPVQQKAVDNDLLISANQIIAAATASGKTLIAEIAALNTIQKGKKVIYITPLKALASEKYESFKEKYESLGVKVALSIGDYDSSESWLSRFDLIICTSEKLDSLLRHGIDWLYDIGLVVVDEIHLLGTEGRGATLEIILTRLKQKISPEILGLSATISNHEELASWLSAKSVESSWRPVKLYKGVSLNKSVSFIPEYNFDLKSSGILGLIEDTIDQGKQALVFVSSRRNAEAAAEQFGQIIKEKLKIDQDQELIKIAEKARGSLERSSKQCRRLASCISTGTGFHHAGLLYNQRKLVEDSFKSGKIKIIVATPTLAWGVNLPASRVIIRDLKRFSMGYGMKWIPVLDVEQMCGRAGRPQYDKEGQAILCAKNDEEIEFIWDNYLLGKPEKINSQLGLGSVLRMHVLSLIAGGVIKKRKDLSDFFSLTFYAHQAQEMYSLEEILDKILEQLIEFEFVVVKQSFDGENILATKIGKRVSELYLDPESAHYLIESLKKAQEKKEMSDFSWFHLFAGCEEAKPLLRINKKDWKWIEKVLLREEPSFLEEVPPSYESEYEDFLQKIKTAEVFYEWVDEKSEDFLLDKFGMTPGELRTRIETLNWLLYSILELGKLIPGFMWGNEIRKMKTRVIYGIKEELLPFIKLKGIGRVRARKLYGAGLRRSIDVRAIPVEILGKILGPKVAKNIKKELT